MPILVVASAKLGGPALIILIIAAGVLTLPIYYFVHGGILYCCWVQACRFCRKNGFEPARWRCRPEFDKSGVKTEFTIIELDCLDASGDRRLIRLRVWLFGVRAILSNEKFAESEED